jgi:hypothetical protein
VDFALCRPYVTLSKDARYKCTPVMKARLTEDVWALEELLASVRATA